MSALCSEVSAHTQTDFYYITKYNIPELWSRLNMLHCDNISDTPLKSVNLQNDSTLWRQCLDLVCHVFFRFFPKLIKRNMSVNRVRRAEQPYKSGTEKRIKLMAGCSLPSRLHNHPLFFSSSLFNHLLFPVPSLTITKTCFKPAIHWHQVVYSTLIWRII